MIDAPPAARAPRLAPLSGAERMRRSRERRRRGLRFLTIELHRSEVEWLIRHGLVARADRDDPVALRKGLYACLHNWLG